MNIKQCSRIIIALILLGTLLLAPALSLAKTVYQWTDPRGQLHITDAPPENRDQGVLLEEIEVQERQDTSLAGSLGLKRSKKIENPTDAVPMKDQFSAWLSSPEMKDFERTSGWMMTAAFALAMASNLFYSLCLYLICRKLAIGSAWMAWIPVLNFFPLVRAAGFPAHYGLLFVLPSLASIPILGINPFVIITLFAILLFDLVFIFVIWIRICRNFWISGWFGLVLLIPPLILILVGYLAFRDEQQEQTVPRLKPALAALVLCLALTTAFHVAYREILMPMWKDKVFNEMSTFLESEDSLMMLQQSLPGNH